MVYINGRLYTETQTSAASKEIKTYYYGPNGNQTARATEYINDGTGTEELELTEGIAVGELSRYKPVAI